MKKWSLSVLVIAAVLLAGQVYVLATGTFEGSGPAEAVTYLKARQADDGGFAETESETDPFVTCWTVIAGKAAGKTR
jgi:hypothetical protein